VGTRQLAKEDLCQRAHRRGGRIEAKCEVPTGSKIVCLSV
jgi:hypothetical protein